MSSMMDNAFANATKKTAMDSTEVPFNPAPAKGGKKKKKEKTLLFSTSMMRR